MSEVEMKKLLEAIEIVGAKVHALHNNLNSTKQELRMDIAGVRDELKSDIADVREELKGEFNSVKKELRSDIHHLGTKVDDLMYEMKDNYDATSTLSREVMILKNKAR
jgi:gas vesicle protein